ncbi:unnamed protein product [Calicophoron daubneyi]|uniref:RWD domain-containing protein n=1 Tax=Calicophoron daubneyi TaxID=300641 RepID=A0AAV2TLA4_CALDB
MHNREIQEDELQALEAIYGDEFSIIEPENNVYSVQVSTGNEDKSDKHTVVLQFQYTPDYPSKDSLKFESVQVHRFFLHVHSIQAPWLRDKTYEALSKRANEVVSSSPDAPVVHLLVETIRSHLQCVQHDKHQENEEPSDFTYKEAKKSTDCCVSVPSVQCHLKALPNRLPIAAAAKKVDIIQGSTLVDRKSVFQAHCARVSSLAEVSSFVSTLLEDRKISTATHNILAYRIIVRGSGGHPDSVLADCDDDGETHAGGRLLHLLTLSDAQNVVVMVSRWYGGIQLGPDRFKHINNVARQLLASNGFIGSSDSKSSENKEQKHKKKKK